LRIVHTSDWHAGRLLRRIDRLPELAEILEHLADFLERERTDLLLVSGDVFDTGAPPAEAERLVFSFFKRVGRAGIESVVLAGNHDSSSRLEAWGGLAELVGVHAVARPAPADRGGSIEIRTRSGETALVAAVPFAAPRDLVSALELASSDTGSRQRYAEQMARIVANVTAPFRADTVNLLTLHTHLDGARFSGSERAVHLGDEWAATAQVLPASAHYVALGHIHRPQRVAAPSPSYYAGSPLQLDFGEAGEEKSFVVVDARPGQPARPETVPYRGGKPLATWTGTRRELEVEAPRLRDAGWLRVTVPLSQPDPDLASSVRRLVPNALRVEAELPEREGAVSAHGPRLGADPSALYARFRAESRGVTGEERELLEAFRRLHAEAEGA